MTAWTSDELTTIEAADADKVVLLVETDDVNDAIDAVFSTKYCRSAAGIIDAITSPQAQSATLKLVPRA